MLSVIIIKYLSYYHLFVFSLTYFILDDIKNKKRINLVLIPLILFFGLFVGTIFTFIDTVILYLFFLILSVKNSNEETIVSSLLTVSSACAIEILVSKALRPFLALMVEKQNVGFTLLFLLVYGLCLSFCILGYKRWIRPFIRRKKKTDLSAFVLTLSLLLYFSYSTFILYASTPFLKFFVSTFYLILMVLGGIIIQSISSNQELRGQAEKRQLEYALHQRYLEELKNQYQGIREFRHDYVNLLTAIEYFIEKKEFVALEHFFNTSVKQTKTMFKQNIIHTNELNKIESLDVRSIVAMKLLAAQEKNIPIQMEVDTDVHLNPTVDSVCLIRILGILLDNAIEEAAHIQEGDLSVAILSLKGDTIFIIENAARSTIEPLHVLKQKGFSTKGAGRGLGLSNIEELTAMEHNILLETIVAEERFIQKVIVIGEEEQVC